MEFVIDHNLIFLLSGAIRSNWSEVYINTMNFIHFSLHQADGTLTKSLNDHSDPFKIPLLVGHGLTV